MHSSTNKILPITEMSRRFEQAVIRQWYRQTPTWGLALAPLSIAFKGVTSWRYRRFRVKRQLPPVPLLVVGNISVGGTGKTPLVIALCQALQQRDTKPIVISRGYGSQAPSYPFVVHPDSDISESGDEPLLIAMRTNVPVIIDADRRRAMQKAVALGADVIISDDGLQHYRMPRSAEIIVLDGGRGLGNGWCLPTGPLRESRQRLNKADWLIINGGDYCLDGAYRMQLVPDHAVNMVSGERRPLADFATAGIIEAVAAIGHPARFFSVLEQAGIAIRRHAFSDHHVFSKTDLAFAGNNLVIMTEKDRVKCQTIAKENYWYLPVTAQLPDELTASICQQLLA